MSGLTHHGDREGIAWGVDQQDEVVFMPISVLDDLPQLGLEQPDDTVICGLDVRPR